MFRPDRIASVYFWGPLARLHRPAGKPRIPIVMYHSISDNLFGKSHPYYQINTAPRIFAQQMRYLHENGYRTVAPDDLTNDSVWTRGNEKLVCITFDDGYRDFYPHAFPILRRYGFSAIIYLATSRIRKTPEVYEGAEYLCWDEVREMHANGIQFGSHTVTHPDMRSLAPEQIGYELGSSKEKIEFELGAAVTSFAYPYAFPEEDIRFVRYFRDLLETNGYTNQVTTILGTATQGSDLFFLPRIPANTWDDPALFKAKLDGGYDWLHWPQKLYKLTHHHMTLLQRAGSLESEETD
jgi:peptidoglycan/xylan/chitin deacetylase (PgdA/CDA1 family)